METGKLRPCLLIYDIPEGRGIANPSRSLYRRGVRVNLSCWVIPEERIPYYRLRELGMKGATWHVVRFADDQIEILLDMIRESLNKQIKDAETRLATSFDNAENKAADGKLSRCYKTQKLAAKRV